MYDPRHAAREVPPAAPRPRLPRRVRATVRRPPHRRRLLAAARADPGRAAVRLDARAVPVRRGGSPNRRVAAGAGRAPGLLGPVANRPAARPAGTARLRLRVGA